MLEENKRIKLRFEIKDLPPLENVNGGLHLGNSHHPTSSLLRNDESKHESEANQAPQTLTRMVTLFSLTIIGSIMIGATARLVFDGWLLAFASLFGGLAGLFLAAICWTSGKP